MLNSHAFWNTQPVPQSTNDQKKSIVGPVECVRCVDDIPRSPYPIASSFEWYTPDLHNECDLHDVYELLRDNYVEDSDSMFRFNYSKEFLQWALMPPNYVPEWHVAIRRKRDSKLLAFISGIPMTMSMGVPHSLRGSIDVSEKTAGESPEHEEAAGADQIFSEPRKICEINFLCVHKQLREKRLTPILIKEVTRRVNLHDIWQAVYTAGVVLPTPFATAQYFHRNLNPEKLVATNFSRIPAQYAQFQNPMSVFKRVCQLPTVTKTKHLRPMEAEDVPQVTRLLREALQKYDVHPIFEEIDVRHHLLPRDNVIYTYVVQAPAGDITDFFSFYHLPSTVIGNSKYDQLRAVYLYYYAGTSISVKQLIQDLLIIAQKDGFDVCNMVEIMENKSFIKDLKFSPGDGHLHYYFYNWSYPKIKESSVALVML